VVAADCDDSVRGKAPWHEMGGLEIYRGWTSLWLLPPFDLNLSDCGRPKTPNAIESATCNIAQRTPNTREALTRCLRAQSGQTCLFAIGKGVWICQSPPLRKAQMQRSQRPSASSPPAPPCRNQPPTTPHPLLPKPKPPTPAKGVEPVQVRHCDRVPPPARHLRHMDALQPFSQRGHVAVLPAAVPKAAVLAWLEARGGVCVCALEGGDG
jgi:hypothetical protein